MKEKWCVYIVECKDGSYYTGVTKNLDKRVKNIKKGKAVNMYGQRDLENCLVLRQLKVGPEHLNWNIK